MLKPASLLPLALSSVLLFSACNPDEAEQNAPQELGAISWPSVQSALSCLAESGPIISAHRGRDLKSKRFADNSLEGLRALRKSGFIMAEIDVAQLKDGTLILYHDGIWDEHSTGRGAVAASSWAQAEKILLKTKRGDITASHLPKFTEVLDWAGGQFYFEIDFKSSADEVAVITAINVAGMTKNVVLISYNQKQAARLRRAGRKITGGDMMVAVSTRSVRDFKALKAGPSLAWTGTKGLNETLISQLNAQSIPAAYGMMSPKYATPANYSALSVIVTDYAREAKQKAGLRQSGVSRLRACK
ncbi:MAG: glycerophosphodiester phosphodiesterase family protein [Robiginitomaculum sp.]